MAANQYPEMLLAYHPQIEWVKEVTLNLGRYADCLSVSKDLVAHRHQHDAVVVDVGRPLKSGNRDPK